MMHKSMKLKQQLINYEIIKFIKEITSIILYNDSNIILQITINL